ncbi:MAG: hypothetical protein WDA19_11685 [Mariniphaga sp.]
MKALSQLERIKKMNRLIKTEHTGSPKEFAAMLGVCESHLFNLIDDLKVMGAPIRYSRIRQTYFYAIDFEIRLQYSLYFVQQNQLKKIYGGDAYKGRCKVGNFFTDVIDWHEGFADGFKNGFNKTN